MALCSGFVLSPEPGAAAAAELALARHDVFRIAQSMDLFAIYELCV